MHRLPVTLLVLAALCLVASVSGCALLQGGQVDAANQVPLLIYDTSWNGSHDTARRDDFYVSLMDVQSGDLATVMVYVVRCGAKESEHNGHWLMLNGPFESGKARKVTPVPVGISVEELLQSAAADRLQITEVRGEAADGKTFDYAADVAKLLAPRIANSCPAGP
ncbi:MAG TPA: hypothetical protein VLV87_05745 [Gammaproteobacteria bacterium]|nr:hypothetical protein [Gammaproteobacteria bacterium]